MAAARTARRAARARGGAAWSARRRRQCSRNTGLAVKLPWRLLGRLRRGSTPRCRGRRRRSPAARRRAAAQATPCHRLARWRAATRRGRSAALRLGWRRPARAPRSRVTCQPSAARHRAQAQAALSEAPHGCAIRRRRRALRDSPPRARSWRRRPSRCGISKSGASAHAEGGKRKKETRVARLKALPQRRANNAPLALVALRLLALAAAALAVAAPKLRVGISVIIRRGRRRGAATLGRNGQRSWRRSSRQARGVEAAQARPVRRRSLPARVSACRRKRAQNADERACEGAPGGAGSASSPAPMPEAKSAGAAPAANSGSGGTLASSPILALFSAAARGGGAFRSRHAPPVHETHAFGTGRVRFERHATSSSQPSAVFEAFSRAR